MHDFVEVFNQFLAENQTAYQCPNVDSLLDMLYCCYQNHRGIDPEEIQAHFDTLYDLLGETVPGKGDDIIHTACQLCGAHQKQAFQEGIVLGFRLYTELHMGTTPVLPNKSKL